MTLNLMPAELVAKIAEDSAMESFSWLPAEVAPIGTHVEVVRHAWIEAAQALEERARVINQEWPGSFLRPLNVIGALAELRSAARALRQAAEEGREP